MNAWEITNTQDLAMIVGELRDELAEWDAELEAADVEDATAWEHFPEMERVMYALAEHELALAEREDFEERYPREEYERDRRELIERGENPRCIMSYEECFAYDRWERELEREREIEEAYDEAYEQMLAEREQEPPTEFDAYGAEERDEIIELAEMAWESSMAELEAFGCIEFEPQFNWHRKGEGGEVHGMVAVCREEYLPAELY